LVREWILPRQLELSRVRSICRIIGASACLVHCLDVPAERLAAFLVHRVAAVPLLRDWQVPEPNERDVALGSSSLSAAWFLCDERRTVAEKAVIAPSRIRSLIASIEQPAMLFLQLALFRSALRRCVDLLRLVGLRFLDQAALLEHAIERFGRARSCGSLSARAGPRTAPA
jgi:hypothetical protein